ncbi:TYSND1 [Acanthosepion pharaonis]|uniref:Peroxisomal leader peptide-processing protease n=1 Tax=Acanthosepion pharaonis TaxID=158019 RepID=A0A812BTM9_ACAPH|nr:TYSND1 [Sepia pharaonis]
MFFLTFCSSSGISCNCWGTIKDIAIILFHSTFSSILLDCQVLAYPFPDVLFSVFLRFLKLFFPLSFKYAVGILVSPFCWKERYWVGLTLACSLSEILHHLSFTKLWFNGSLSDSKETYHLKALPVSITPTSFSVLKDTNQKTDANVSKVTRIFPNVCRVISRHGNGSGIVFGADLILTCSHVIGKDTKVSVKLYKETEWRNAVVKYATPKDEPLDLAVLSLDDPSASIGTIVSLKTTQAVEGLCIYAIGHGLFSASFDSNPSITSGTVSRIVYHGGKQILIQSSCALYPGSSGGPLVNEKGQVVSMSRSNVTMLNDNPHVSISVPMEIVMSVLQEYRKTKNVDVLKKLWLQDPDSKRLWQLKSLPESRSSLTSKLSLSFLSIISFTSTRFDLSFLLATIYTDSFLSFSNNFFCFFFAFHGHLFLYELLTTISHLLILRSASSHPPLAVPTVVGIDSLPTHIPPIILPVLA